MPAKTSTVSSSSTLWRTSSCEVYHKHRLEATLIQFSLSHQGPPARKSPCGVEGAVVGGPKNGKMLKIFETFPSWKVGFR